MSLDASTLTWAALWVRGWGCRCVQLGNAESVSSALFFCLSTFLSFLSICDFDSRLQQKTSGGSNRLGLTLRASEPRHSEQQPEWFFYLLTSVIPRDKTCCELRQAERILPRCRPMKATFSPTDERRSNHKFNSNLIFYNLRFEPFFMSCRYNRTYLTMSQ